MSATSLLRGFRSLQSAEDFEDFMQRISPELLDYTGGTTPRSAIHGKIDAPWTTDYFGPSIIQRLDAWLQRPRMKDRFYYHSTHADGSEIRIDDLECIRRVIAETMVMFDWQSSDVLVCDNKLCAHGRQPYTPPRRILAALAADRAIRN